MALDQLHFTRGHGRNWFRPPPSMFALVILGGKANLCRIGGSTHCVRVFLLTRMPRDGSEARFAQRERNTRTPKPALGEASRSD
jgi:hypothetical protein